MARLLEGKPVADKIKEELKRQIESLKKKPVLASIQAGDNAGAAAYVKSQQKTAQNLGIEYQLHSLNQDINEAELIKFIQKLNSDNTINGIIIQMPLPSQIDYKKISQFIDPEKDAEGMHPANIGKIVFGKANILPCTPAAVMELIKETGIDLYGREVVIVGHSEIVGKPLSLLLLEKFATVTVCHTNTRNLREHTLNADILMTATGVPKLIKANMVKEGVIIVDIGISRINDKIIGDVDFDLVKNKCSYITPVPGGVGPMTIISLIENLIEISEKS